MILIVMGSGGHTKRGLTLAKHIVGTKKYIVPYEAEITKAKVMKDYFSVLSPRFKAKSNKILTVIRTLFLFLHSFMLILIIRPDICISTGSGLSYPVQMMAKMLGVKTVYIESPSRVYVPSVTGKLLLGKVDLWLASWSELKKYSSSIKYIGLLM